MCCLPMCNRPSHGALPARPPPLVLTVGPLLKSKMQALMQLLPGLMVDFPFPQTNSTNAPLPAFLRPMDIKKPITFFKKIQVYGVF